LWLINCALFNSFLVYENPNPGSKLKYKKFLVQVAKAWATQKIQATQTQSDTESVRPWPSTHTPRRPHVDAPGRLSGDMRKHVLRLSVKSRATPQLKWLVAGFPQRRPGPMPRSGKWDLWWIKWHRGRFSPSTSVSPAKTVHSTKFSILIITRGRYNRPGVAAVPSERSMDSTLQYSN
jgi:hypothetical protein